RLSYSLHKRGMKLIQDAVYNHVGLYHFLVQDLPEKSWLHQWPKYTQTNYRDQPIFDPHASDMDRKLSGDVGVFLVEVGHLAGEPGQPRRRRIPDPTCHLERGDV